MTAITSIPRQPTRVGLFGLLALVMLLVSGCQPATSSPTSTSSASPAPTATVVNVPAVPTLAIVTTWPPPARTKTTGCAIQGGLPDAACTPGAVDARVNQGDLGTTVCSRGYTATVRPPVNVTEKIKRDQMAAYGLTGQRLADYELDHLISLELGGAPADVGNLWPEPWAGDGNAHQKDAVENFLNREVCRGTIPLVEAQRMIATDWLAVYRSRGLTPAQ